MEKNFFVYMMANAKNGTLYIGVTSDLPRRVWEHKNKVTGGFTSKYNVENLVWYEQQEDAENAIHREKRLKKYSRAAKIELIEFRNGDWKDLYEEICG